MLNLISKEHENVKVIPYCENTFAEDVFNCISNLNSDYVIFFEGDVEYSEDGIFEDRATQVVLNRDFPKVEYTVKDSVDELEITTSRLRILYDKKEFSERGLGVYVLSVPLEYDTYHVGWRYGWKLPNFGGTTRTLDQINGACEIRKKYNLSKGDIFKITVIL
mgnify:CR=1 FL=1